MRTFIYGFLAAAVASTRFGQVCVSRCVCLVLRPVARGVCVFYVILSFEHRLR